MGRFGESQTFSNAFLKWSFLALCWYNEVLLLDNIYTVVGQLQEVNPLKEPHSAKGIQKFSDPEVTFSLLNPQPHLFRKFISGGNFEKPEILSFLKIFSISKSIEDSIDATRTAQCRMYAPAMVVFNSTRCRRIGVEGEVNKSRYVYSICKLHSK